MQVNYLASRCLILWVWTWTLWHSFLEVTQKKTAVVLIFVFFFFSRTVFIMFLETEWMQKYFKSLYRIILHLKTIFGPAILCTSDRKGQGLGFFLLLVILIWGGLSFCGFFFLQSNTEQCSRRIYCTEQRQAQSCSPCWKVQYWELGKRGGRSNFTDLFSEGCTPLRGFSSAST